MIDNDEFSGIAKTPWFFDEKPIGLLINILAERFEQEFLWRLTRSKEFSAITMAEHRILKNLAHGSSNSSAVAARMGVTKQAVSKAIAALRRKGFVVVKPMAQDKRAQILTLTAKGSRLVTHGVQIARELDQLVAAHLGDEELGQLRRLLLQLEKVQLARP